MATYYKYAERNAADQVDWSAIGKSITDTLSDEIKRREDAKQKIADASNKDAETLSNAPMGQSKGINDFTLSFANNAEQFRLMQDRMLQSGRMKLRDYNIGRANLMSGTKELFNLSKEYNAVYNEKMKRQQDKDSQAFETWAMGNIEGYSNFSNTGAYIDPNTGRVSLAKKIETTQPDGTVIYEISKNPNDFKSVNELRNIINVKYNRFKVAENLQPEVDSLGEYVKVQMKDGVKTLEDVKKRKGYKKVRDQYINSIIETNPDNVMSILTDYIGAVINEDGEPGESFDFTYDPNEATSENMILMVRNPNTDRFEADFSTANGKKQKEMARKALQAKFDSMIDVKETAMPQLSVRERLIRGQTESAIDNLAKLWYGTPQEIDSASKFLQGVISNLVGIDVQEDKVILTKTDKDGSRTGKKGGRYPVEYAREDFDLFIESIAGELGGTVSASEAVKIARGKLPKDRTAKGGIGTFLIPEAVGLPERFGNYIETYLTTTEPLSKDEDDAKSQLEGLLKPFGNFEIDTDTFGNELTITYPTGKTTAPLELEVDLDDADAVQQIKNFLVNNLSFFEEGVAIQESNINEALSGAGTKKSQKGDDILKGTD